MKKSKLEKFFKAWCEVVGGIFIVLLVTTIITLIVCFFIDAYTAICKINDMKMPQYHPQYTSLTVASSNIKTQTTLGMTEWVINKPNKVCIQFDEQNNVKSVFVDGNEPRAK